MLTLSAATTEVKSVLKWGGIAIGIFTILYLTFRLINNFIQNSKPPPAPTVTFGKLPPVSFPSTQITQPTTYSIDTITGQLPTSGTLPGQFPDRMTVYKIARNSPNLLALQNAKTKVAQDPLGFKADPIALSQTLYEWAESTPPNRRLRMDIITGNFSLSSAFLTDPDVLSAQHAPDEPTALETSQTFLGPFGGLPPDIDSTRTKTQLITLVNGTLIPATSLSSAQVIQVNFFQKDIENLHVYYPQGTGSPMQFLVGGGKNASQVVNAEYTHQVIGEESGTYPIKTAVEAYKNLQDGNAYIAINSFNKQGISIRQVTRGYYIGGENQDYAFPIIVFSGDGFLAYVPAITEQWVQK